MRTPLLVVGLGLAASAASAQFTITPGGANAGNGQFGQVALPAAAAGNLTGAGHLGTSFFSATPAGTDNLFQSWWWFRQVGDNREHAFGNGTANGYTIAGSTVGNNTGSADTGGFDFMVTGAAGFMSQQRWRITSTANGPSVTMTNVITNNSGVTLNLALFAYNDFDPNGSFTHPYSWNGNGFSMSSGPVAIEWNAVSPISAYQANPFASLRTLLADGAVTNLNNTVTGNPGDFTGAMQYNLTIPAGGSATVSSVFAFVPAPSSLALLGLGGMLASRRRRA